MYIDENNTYSNVKRSYLFLDYISHDPGNQTSSRNDTNHTNHINGSACDIMDYGFFGMLSIFELFFF